MKKIVTICILLLIAGCGTKNPKVPTNSMAFENVSYVDQFPISIQLNGGKITDIESPGFFGFTIQDSLMIISVASEKGSWAFYSLPEHRYLGNYLQMGHANNEFNARPYTSSSTFFKENDTLYAAISDPYRGVIHKMNITETLKRDTLTVSPINIAITGDLFRFVYINDTKCLIREIDGKETRQTRSIYNNVDRKSTKNLDKLNFANVQSGKNFNILSTLIGYNPERTIIVEVPTKLNHINLYALDDSFSKTICLGKEVDNIDILQLNSGEKEMYTSMTIESYKNFFCVLYLNDLKTNFASGNEKIPSILFFNWKGEPLAEIKLERKTTHFVVDTINKNLYTADRRTEEIYQYDISDLLNKLL